MQNGKKWLIIVLCVIFIGTFLRGYKLDRQNFWIDESTAIQKSKHLPSCGEFESWVIHWMCPPAYNLLLHFWIVLFGETESAVRSLSVILGILSVILVYIVGVDLFNRKIALLSTFVIAISPFHIAFSQDAKMYAMLAFLGLLSFYLFYKTLFSNKKFYWLIYFFITTLMLYTHNWGVFLLISENIFFLLVRKYTSNTKKYLLSQLFIGLCYLPWLPFLFKQVMSVKIYVTHPVTSIYTMPALFAVYSGKIIHLGEDVLEMGPFPSVISVSVYAVLFFWGLAIKEQGRIDKYYFWKEKQTLLLVCCFFLTLGIPFLIAFKFPIFYTRYTNVVFPLFCLLIGKGLSKIKHFWWRNLTILILLFVSFFTLYRYYYFYAKSYDKLLTDYVSQNSGKNDLMVIAPGWIGMTFSQYYKDYNKDKLEIVKVVNPSRLKARQIVENLRNMKGFNKLILLYTDNIPNCDLKDFKNYLDNSLCQFCKKNFRNKEIIFYRLKITKKPAVPN